MKSGFKKSIKARPLSSSSSKAEVLNDSAIKNNDDVALKERLIEIDAKLNHLGTKKFTEKKTFSEKNSEKNSNADKKTTASDRLKSKVDEESLPRGLFSVESRDVAKHQAELSKTDTKSTSFKNTKRENYDQIIEENTNVVPLNRDLVTPSFTTIAGKVGGEKREQKQYDKKQEESNHGQKQRSFPEFKRGKNFKGKKRVY